MREESEIDQIEAFKKRDDIIGMIEKSKSKLFELINETGSLQTNQYRIIENVFDQIKKRFVHIRDICNRKTDPKVRIGQIRTEINDSENLFDTYHKDFNNNPFHKHMEKLENHIHLIEQEFNQLEDRLKSLSRLSSILKEKESEVKLSTKLMLIEKWPLPSWAMALATVGFGAFSTSMVYFLINIDTTNIFVFLAPAISLATSLVGFYYWRREELKKIQSFKEI